MRRKERRTGQIREVRRARLDGYRIAFNKLGDDGTGKANLRPDRAGVVWGAVYLCSPATLERMDGYEGVRGGHYCRKRVRVRCEYGEVQEAVTYVAGERFVCPSLVPDPSYLKLVLDGARALHLPQEYVKEIELAAKGGS